MKHLWKVLVLCTVAILTNGCAGSLGKESFVVAPPNAVIELQNKNIAMLTNYLQELKANAGEMQAVQPDEDPLSAEIQTIDLAGTNLRIETLSILLDHCQVTREILLEAQADPSKKKELLKKFRKRRKALMVKLEENDLKQNRLERRRIEMGQKMVEEALQ